MVDIKKLVEEYDKLKFKEDVRDEIDEFCRKVSEIINKEFDPMYRKLWQLAKDFHDAHPETDIYNLMNPQVDRDLDYMAQATGIIKDLINGKPREKGLEKKIRKVLGYNG